MSLYSACSQVGVGLAAALLCGLYVWRRSAFLRPSVLFSAWHLIMVQVAAAVYADEIAELLPRPWEYAALTFGIPLFLLMFNWMRPETERERTLFSSLTGPLGSPNSAESLLHWMLGGAAAVVIALYLLQVGLSNTGIYALFTDPLGQTQARERSLKLVTDPVIRYGYNLLRSFVGPLLAAGLAIGLCRRWDDRKRASPSVLGGLPQVAGILALLLAVSLTGARAAPAVLILAVALALFIRRGLRVRLAFAAPLVALILIVPILITIQREAEDNVTVSRFWEYVEAIVGRLCEDPMRTGLWHTHLCQVQGPVGIAGVRPLAELYNVPYVDLPNIIGLEYAFDPIETVSADTGLVYDYYACFGGLAFLLGPLLLLSLDWMAAPVLNLEARPAIPLLAVLALKSMNFVEAPFTVTLVTHGFLLVPLVAVFSRNFRATSGSDATREANP